MLDYLSDKSVFDYRDGYVAVPRGPGLGIEIDETKVRSASDHTFRWRNPLLRRPDGSIAEW